MRLGQALRAHASEMAEATAIRLHQELPDYYNVPSQDFQAAGYGALPAVLSSVWSTLENDGRRPEHLPSHLEDEALNAARNDVPWEVVDRSYGITHEVIWEAVLEETSSWKLARDDQKLVLQVASRFLFRCFDFLTTAAGQVYERARAEWVDRRQKRLLELVNQAIDGLAVPDAELGYRTQQQHLAVVGWGKDPLGAISSAARALGADLLNVPSTGSGVWGWLGRPSFASYSSVIAAFKPDPRTYLAVGSIERGREGFSASHQQAQLASRLAVRQLLPSTRSVIAYPDVALEALALADERRARIFVDHVLGPLAATDPRSVTLRETVRVYCEAGQNTAAAAKRLGVAERTVRYRLRAAEDHLGRATVADVMEIAIAVRLFNSLEGQASNRFPATTTESEPTELRAS